MRKLLGYGFFVLLLVLWEVVGRLDATGIIVPPTETVPEIIVILTGPSLTADVIPSIVRTLLGYVIGGALGIVIGLLIGWFRAFEPWARGVIEFSRAVPPPALVPVVFLILGANDATRVLLIAFATFWPVFVNTVDGTRRIDPGFVDAAHVYTSSRSATLLRVVLPAASPQIFTGLRIGLALALIMMIVSEMISSTSGLGYIILSAQRYFQLPKMYAGIVIIGVLGILFVYLFRQSEKRALAWFEGQKGIRR